jgi:flagellar FliJ protein
MGNSDHRLQPALEVARSKEDTAARALAEFQRRLGEQQTRLQQLLDFRREYGAQFQTAGQDGISVRRFQDYAIFMAKLDRTILQCKQDLERLQREFQHKHYTWTMSHAKTQALEEVVKRDRRQQAQLAGFREQADSDEHNLRSYGHSAKD